MGNPLPGLFRRWVKKTPIWEVPFWYNMMLIFNILETAEGIERPIGGGWGFGWRFVGTGSGGIPDGYEEITGTLFMGEKKVYGTFLVKTSGKTETAYESTDKRLLLGVTEPSTGVYSLDLDKGYLKE